MIASLNADGIMGVVMPHGLLFRGSSEKAIRQGILEDDLLELINETGIGPQLGGTTSCLGVNIEWGPTHIAGLPVAVTICCHACRHAKRVL